MPRRAVVSLLSACLVLGLGGIVVDHFFSGPDATPVSKPVATKPPPLAGGGPAEVAAPIPALMDLRPVTAAPAPSFVLRDGAGRPVRLSGLRGSVVVLSFFDSRCDDICPVLAAELRLARSDLARDASRVAFVIVNSDPLATGGATARPAERAGLPVTDRWYFLTGSLQQLDHVWTLYGLTVDVQPATRRVAHNEFLFFIDAAGRLRARAVPFGNESRTGRFSLPSSLEARWAEGIAAEARSLLGRRP